MDVKEISLITRVPFCEKTVLKQSKKEKKGRRKKVKKRKKERKKES